MSCVGGCGCWDVAECAVTCGCCDEENNIEIQVIVKVFARFSPWHSPGVPYTTLILILVYFVSRQKKEKKKMNRRHFDIDSPYLLRAHHDRFRISIQQLHSAVVIVHCLFELNKWVSCHWYNDGRTTTTVVTSQLLNVSELERDGNAGRHREMLCDEM